MWLICGGDPRRTPSAVQSFDQNETVEVKCLTYNPLFYFTIAATTHYRNWWPSLLCTATTTTRPHLYNTPFYFPCWLAKMTTLDTRSANVCLIQLENHQFFVEWLQHGHLMQSCECRFEWTWIWRSQKAYTLISMLLHKVNDFKNMLSRYITRTTKHNEWTWLQTDCDQQTSRLP